MEIADGHASRQIRKKSQLHDRKGGQANTAHSGQRDLKGDIQKNIDLVYVQSCFLLYSK